MFVGRRRRERQDCQTEPFVFILSTRLGPCSVKRNLKRVELDVDFSAPQAGAACGSDKYDSENNRT